MPQTAATPDRAFPALYTLHNYLFCMMASTVLMQRPVLGGAMFLAGQVADLSLRFLPQKQSKQLPRGARAALIALSALCSLLTLGMLLVYPRRVGLNGMWLLFGLVLMITLRSLFSQKIAVGHIRKDRSLLRTRLLLGEITFVFSLIAAPVLFFSLSGQDAWYLWGGFVITSILESVLLAREKDEGAAVPIAEAPDNQEALSSVNAYRVFRRVLALTVAALQITMILIYTFIGTTAGELFISMAVAFVCTVLVGRVTGRIARRHPERDPSNVLLCGLILWLTGLIAFLFRRSSILLSYLALAACSAGTATALTAFWHLDASMREVVCFATGAQPAGSIDSTLSVSLRYAELSGQMVALLGLSLMVFFGEAPDAFRRGVLLQPVLLLPALMLVAAAVMFALRFPLRKEHLEKLHAFLMLKKSGQTNVPLQKQLEDVVINVNKRHYGIRVLMFFVRLFIYNRVEGRENVPADKDVSLVFICNHGEIYGPIVANVYIPFPVRPWVMSEMVDASETTDYVYEGTFKRQKWLPERLRYPAAKIVTPIINWGMEGVGSIPVYRNKPRELVRTFRATVNAMEAGDNILIFPENPYDERQFTGSYVREGVGEFFTGFTMIAPLYHKRTGKKCVFVPIYADKKRHTLTFGIPTVYDPDNEPNAEKERLCDTLRGEMLRMAGMAQEE